MEENEVIENNNNPDINPDENLDSSSKDNFETKVKKRNEQAEEAKEQLSPVPEDDEEEEEKSHSLFEILGYGLIAASAAGIVFNVLKIKKTVQTTQIATNEGVSNGK